MGRRSPWADRQAPEARVDGLALKWRERHGDEEGPLAQHASFHLPGGGGRRPRRLQAAARREAGSARRLRPKGEFTEAWWGPVVFGGGEIERWARASPRSGLHR